MMMNNKLPVKEYSTLFYDSFNLLKTLLYSSVRLFVKKFYYPEFKYVHVDRV